MADELVKVKASVDVKGSASGELALSEHFPGLVERFLPWARRASIDAALSKHIWGKLEKGERITRADADFAEAKFGEAAGVYFRRLEIAGRAVAALDDPSIRTLPSVSAHNAENPKQAEGGPTTADEWIRRFWEDAGAISDEVLQEIYARLLASEVNESQSVSLRTLRALRYLDRPTADTFARVVPHVVAHAFLPRGEGMLDVTFSDLLELTDAGLLTATGQLQWQVDAPSNRFMTWGRHVVELRCEGPPWIGDKHTIDAYPLTAAGRELLRVARVERNPAYLGRLIRWLFSQVTPKATMRMAEAPYDNWSGRPSELTWQEIEKPT